VLLYDCVHPSQSDLTNYGIDKITKKFNVCTMNAALDHLSHEALILPHDQRVALAYKLLTSVEPDPEPDCELAWSNEILRRIQTYDTGATKAIPAAEVFDRLKKLPQLNEIRVGFSWGCPSRSWTGNNLLWGAPSRVGDSIPAGVGMCLLRDSQATITVEGTRYGVP